MTISHEARDWDELIVADASAVHIERMTPSAIWMSIECADGRVYILDIESHSVIGVRQESPEVGADV